MSKTHEDVKQYYGETLTSKEDLLTSACCPSEAMPKHLRPLVANIHDDILTKFYGCGSPIPPMLKGMTVLDLGSGSGQDCYLLSQLVGESGKVIGVDMTDQQLDVARQYIDYHTEKFGYLKPNISFVKHFIEDLSSIADNSIDLVVSNCVINLTPNKQKVFSEIHRVLKLGGELYFSDIFADRRLGDAIKSDPVLVGECLGGALYIEDYRRQMSALGFNMSYVVSNSILPVDNPALAEKLSHINFTSQTMRAFKLDVEDREENYGHQVKYLGTIAEYETAYAFDQTYDFPNGQWVAISGNMAKILSQSRYAKAFEIKGDFSTHYGGLNVKPVTEKPSGCC